MVRAKTAGSPLLVGRMAAAETTAGEAKAAATPAAATAASAAVSSSASEPASSMARIGSLVVDFCLFVKPNISSFVCVSSILFSFSSAI